METTEFTEHDVVREVLNGDRNKYSILIQKYNQRLYRICKAYLKDENEVEDTMQDAYVKAFEHLQKFEWKSSFGTWITRIMINECLQRLRRQDKYRFISNSTENTRTMSISDSSNPETRSVNKELRILLEEKVAALPESYKLVFIMREVEKMNVSETAEALLITQSNVKVRLNRAKEMLRKSLLETYPLQDLFEFNLVRCKRIADGVMSRIMA